MTVSRPATAKPAALKSVAVLLRSDEAYEAVTTALSGVDGLAGRVRLGRLAAASPWLEERGIDLLVLDLDMADEAELAALVALAERVRGRVPVLVTARAPTLEGMRTLMRLGIADLVPQPLRRSDLLAAVEAALARSPGAAAVRPRRGRVVAVMKATGGAGATTTAVLLAAALARRERQPGRVGLLDLDLQFGSAGLHLDVEAGEGLAALVRSADRLDGALLRGTMARHGSGLDVLPAPAAVMPLDLLTPETAVGLVETAAGEYGHVVIDLPLAWTAWSRAVLGCADTVLLVLQATLPSLRHARRQVETLREEGLGDTPLIPVLNRFAPRTFGRNPELRDAERALGCEVRFHLPSDYRAVTEAVDAGAPLFDTGRGRGIVRQVRRLAEEVANAPAAKGTPPAAALAATFADAA
ncbi:AAA family ATPase [Azospirillum sp. ST 5-10]|uniref:AAA family ATPase n=1 Tax=unclassified Azospirillum TaxID=2630922 RepID=UPI003F49DC8B